MRYLLYILILSATATFGQDTLTQPLLGDTTGSVLVDCSSDYDTEIFRLQGDLRKPADYGDSATAAYSLRYVTSSYDSVVVRVRRSSDNAELDFYPQHIGDSLVSWVGGENLLRYSEQFDDADWGKTFATITPNATTAPDGTMTADNVTWDAVSGLHIVFQQISFTTGLEYTATYFVKDNGLNYIQIYNAGGAFVPIADRYANFDIQNGILGTSTFSDASIEDYGNGWYRISVTETAQSTNNGVLAIVGIQSMSDGYRPSFTGDGTSGIYIWGAQLEQADTLTDYFKTEGVANSGDGFVTIWYDQMNANHATQSTASAQPKIVNAGALIEENGKPAINFGGVDDGLVSTFNDTLLQPYRVIVVVGQLSSGSGFRAFIGGDDINNRVELGANSLDRFYLFAGVTNQSSYNLVTSMNLLSALVDGINYVSLANGNPIDSGDVGTNSLDGISIGKSALSGFDWDNNILEIFIGKNIDNDEINSEINSYYNITSSIPDLTDTRIIRQSDSLQLLTGQVDTTFIGLPTQEDRIALTWEADTIRVSLNGADAISKGVNYMQDYTEWFFSTQSPVTYYELIRWVTVLTENDIKTLTE